MRTTKLMIGLIVLALTLSAWRGWYRWLVRQHGFKANPLVGLRRNREPRMPVSASCLPWPHRRSLAAGTAVAQLLEKIQAGLNVGFVATMSVGCRKDRSSCVG